MTDSTNDMLIGCTCPEDSRVFSSEPFRILFDQTEVHRREDREVSRGEGLRLLRILLVHPWLDYGWSMDCRCEWEQSTRMPSGSTQRRGAAPDAGTSEVPEWR
jgi:hypothetical protein